MHTSLGEREKEREGEKGRDWERERESSETEGKRLKNSGRVKRDESEVFDQREKVRGME